MPPANQVRPDLEAAPLELSEPHVPAARMALVARLCEIVSWPESRIQAYERQLAADVLVGLLRTSNIELRRRCAHGLVRVADAPKGLLRYLARDEISVAAPLLEGGVGFDDSDLVASVRAGVAAHWQAIARRRNLSETVTDALFATGDTTVIELVLRNQFAKLSTQGVDQVVARSRQAPNLPKHLVGRLELRPTQALVLFWWARFEERVQILRRFAIDRNVLIQELGDVFRIAAAEGWADADTRKTLQVVERRQRNRAAAAQSPYGSLEGALAAAERGLDRALLYEIAHLAGIKPTTAQQILSDPGGEAIGVLCKATGLKRPNLISLWRSLRRPWGDTETTDNPLGRTVYVFDTLATAKAQTVLRYWNWSFTADAANVERMSFDDNALELTLARRNAALLFNRNG
ncbi:MAG: DUF2336 domain-containing protein [Caulobacterales bacterium]|jgi:uncharacterized protein (DUF2336 family)|nr:DUF2336 domain-containing protein [Caulobacterales bacterium]